MCYRLLQKLLDSHFDGLTHEQILGGTDIKGSALS